MFLLRCAFWLSIVYAAILWHHGAFSWHDSGSWQDAGPPAGAKARVDAQALIAKAAAGVTDTCAGHARECLADAARLTSLFMAAEPTEALSREPEPGRAEAPGAEARGAATAGAEAPDAATAGAATPVEDRVPLPVPDPRRRNQDAKLARAP